MASPTADRPGVARCEGCGKDIAPSWGFCAFCGQDNRAPERRHEFVLPHAHQGASGAFCVQGGARAFGQDTGDPAPVSDSDRQFWNYVLVPWRRVLIGLILTLAGCAQVGFGIRAIITKVGYATHNGPAPTGWMAQVQ